MKTLAKTFKIMPSSSRLTLPPSIRLFSDIREGDMMKIWITDDHTVHIRKIKECDDCVEHQPCISVESIVELLNEMPSENKAQIIKGITPPCFDGGFADV